MAIHWGVYHDACHHDGGQYSTRWHGVAKKLGICCRPLAPFLVGEHRRAGCAFNRVVVGPSIRESWCGGWH